uniref:Uncharacterized protein n=1 Tax=Glycine max TaxID=3847 RepID=C6TCX2_SOYBN|nr:unknown [Glycine max]
MKKGEDFGLLILLVPSFLIRKGIFIKFLSSTKYYVKMIFVKFFFITLN